MDSGMRKNSKKVTTGCRQPCDILHHWSGKGYLSSYDIFNSQYDTIHIDSNNEKKIGNLHFNDIKIDGAV